MKLFMQAHELMDVQAGDDRGPMEFRRPMSQSSDIRDRKVLKAKSGGEDFTYYPPTKGEKTLYDSIRDEGIKSPVALYIYGDNKELLSDGHHRVAAANDINPHMYIPVRYAN